MDALILGYVGIAVLLIPIFAGIGSTVEGRRWVRYVLPFAALVWPAVLLALVVLWLYGLGENMGEKIHG